jgi:hypothetical protein
LFEISKYVARPSALDGADDGSEDQAQSAPPKAAAAPKAKAETPEF